MKILYDQQIFGWQDYGGISRYIYELALEMATTYGQDTNIVSPLYVNQYLKCAPGALKVYGVPIGHIPRTGRVVHAVNFFLTWPIIRYLHPDIVHETYYSSRRIAPKSTKVVLTVYDMIHERFSELFSKNDPTSRKKALAVERADHVICISEQTRQDLIELFGVNPAKTSVVYLGFTLTDQDKPVQKADTSARPFLLYVGGRGGYKNFEKLLHAYAASSMLRNDFDLVCFGGGELTAKEKDLFQRLALASGSVRQVSGDDASLAEYYKLASAFIYPSLYEGFGIPPLEAMSFDCPVVCSGVSSIPEVVGDAAEMFDPYEPDSIRMAIERVVSDDVLKQALIARGRERIKLFSWRRCAQETLDVYRRVLS
jgi:glycosyltransferase involved in cell wall biosynthesis